MSQPGRPVLIRTDADTDFTAALAQNAAIFASFQSKAAGQCFWVESIQVISVENLAWELWFFDRETTAIPADPNADGFRGRWSFQAADGLQIAGAGTFHYNIQGLAIPVECLDYNLHADKYPELHVALVNRSGASKSADAAGAIVVQFGLCPGLGGI